MQFRTSLVATGALVAALAVGAMQAPAVQAAPQGQLNDFYVLDQDAFMVQLVVDAPATLAGEQCMILQGPAPFGGIPVNGLILQPGVNLTFAPQIGPCWLTAVGPSFQPRSTGQSGDGPALE